MLLFPDSMIYFFKKGMNAPWVLNSGSKPVMKFIKFHFVYL